MASKTLSETGTFSAQEAMPTSSEVTAPSAQVVGQKAPVGQKIAKDIASIMQTGSNIRQMDNTLSVDAAKRVVIDEMNNTAVQMAKVREITDPTAESQRQAKELNSAIYQAGQNKIFDNDDAQRAFDQGYLPARAAVAKENARLEQLALDNDAIDLRSHYLKVSDNMIENGTFTKHSADTIVKAVTNNGRIKKDQFENDLMSLQIAAFVNDANNTNFTFQGYVKIDEDGKREYLTDNQLMNENIEGQYQISLDKAEARATEVEREYMANAVELAKASLYEGASYTDEEGITHKYSATFKDFEARIKEAYPLLDTNSTNYEKVMNMYREPDAATEGALHLADRLYDNNNQGGSIINRDKFYGQITDRRDVLYTLLEGATKEGNQFKIKKSIQKLDDMEARYKFIDGLVMDSIETGDYTTIENYIKTGTTIPDDDVGIVVSTTQVKNIVGQWVNRMDYQLIDMHINDDQKGKPNTQKIRFDDAITKLYKLADAGGLKSQYLVSIGKEFNSNYLQSIDDVSQGKKMLIAAQVALNDTNNAYEIVMGQSQIAELSSIIENTSIKDEERVALFNKVKLMHRLKRGAVINGSKSNTLELVEYYNGKGGDTRLELSLLNWVMRVDNSVQDKEVMTKDQGYDMIQANTVIYRRRESSEEGFDLAAEAGRTGASLVVDRYDSIVLPSRIGTHTNKNGSIEKAFTGVLRHFDLHQDDVYVRVSDKGNVLVFRSDTNAYLTEINDENLQTFEKNGKNR